MAHYRCEYRNDGTVRRLIDGREVSESEFNRINKIGELVECGSVPGGHLPACWPQHSYSVGVHTSMIKSEMERDAKDGVPTEIDAKGRRVFRDRNHRRAWCKMRGVIDTDGGYGDRT